METEEKPQRDYSKFASAARVTSRDGKRRFYRYYLDEPQSYRMNIPAPSLPVSLDILNKELLKIGGVDSYGDQRIKIFWAGTLPEVKYYLGSDGKTHEFIGKKYMAKRARVVTGYSYLADNGEKVTVKEQHTVPKDKVLVPESEVVEWGELIWVIEYKFTGEEMVSAGYLPAPGSEREKTFAIKDGNRYRKPFDPRGEYVPAVRIEELEYDKTTNQITEWYRDVTMQDVENIRRVYQRALSESEPEFVEKVISRTEDIEKRKAQIEREQQRIIISEAADRVERKPIGREFYT